MKNKWLSVLLLLTTCATAQDYKIAEPGYTFAFPRDYFNHSDYQTEWWYYTGNVRSTDGHRFGYELTFFRQGVSRAESSQPWFVHDLWMAHIALSDITGQRFYNEERLNRTGPGIAGVDAHTGMIWNGNWKAHIAAPTANQGVEARTSIPVAHRPTNLSSRPKRSEVERSAVEAIPATDSSSATDLSSRPKRSAVERSAVEAVRTTDSSSATDLSSRPKRSEVERSAVQRTSSEHTNLQGIADKFSLAFDLESVKQPVIQGQNGASQKAEGTGHASHYFSLTRLLTTGSINLDGKTYQVEGTSWMDHEFFTGSMATNESGWDWLSIQLQDGADLMLYRMRHNDGSIDPNSSGSYVDQTGKSQFLSSRDFAMNPATTPTDLWTSPATKATYPLRWHISIPRLKLELDVTTPIRNQELTGKFGTTYWEGAIDLAGARDQSPVGGVGYLEMVGYAKTENPIIPR
jgi:predicted secreted hydrolase